MRHREASDEELALLLRDRRCSAVEAEAYRRFKPLGEVHARLFCQQLFHRGAECRGHGSDIGSCDGVFETAFSEIMRRVLGVDGPRPLRSVLVSWATTRRDPSQPFGAFLAMALHVDDVLRAWCADRQLPTRGDRPPAAMIDDLHLIYQGFWEVEPSLRRFGALAPEQPAVIVRWLEGLWRDAVQTGDGNLIDSVRVARWMLRTGDPSAADAAAIGHIACRIDDHLARTWPDWYDKYLDHGRQQTNVALPIDTYIALENVEDDEGEEGGRPAGNEVAA